MGGGGFGSVPGDPALDRYVLDAAEARAPRICLLPTASGDPKEQIDRFYRAFHDLDCEPTHISLFRMAAKPIDLRALLLSQDVIYVGGGSMLNLMAIWRAHGIDAILREAHERGVVLCGISAGSMCWFTAGITKSFGAPRLAQGLGFLPASNSVHYHNEVDRRPCFLEAVRTAAAPPGYGVDDGVGLLFAGTELVEAVSARTAAGAWRVEQRAAATTETPLEIVKLPSAEPPDTVEAMSITEFREARRAALGTHGGRAGRIGR
ncbi:MAG: Type 1 glutamine amidotransferase-like domain-containing protein [Thermoleophilaceae bacterium]